MIHNLITADTKKYIHRVIHRIIIYLWIYVDI